MNLWHENGISAPSINKSTGYSAQQKTKVWSRTESEQNRVMHRDLKPDNILMCKDGYLKVADFGMAREFKLSPRQYTPGMCSLWYRAPELLLLSKEYSTSVDMWSIGCIFAEFINIWPLFLGESETDQLKKIYKVLGTPSDTVWPGYSTLPLVGDITFDEYAPSGLRKELKHKILSDSGLDLLQRMLIYDPKRRISAKEALRHKYFDDEPVTISPDEFLKSLDLEDDHEDTESNTGGDEHTEYCIIEILNYKTVMDNKRHPLMVFTEICLDRVAVKYLKYFDSEERFSIAAARELKFLMNLWHENIVLVHELAMGSSRSEMFIVMEYLPHQLRSLLDTVRNKRQRFGPEHIHCLMTQLIRAMAYLHQNRVMHRDLKPDNILMCKDGYLKVADFGMARECKLPLRQYTPGMCTLWYRAPELLLLSKEYSTSVDMWSIGCIFAEFINLWPLFQGKSETDQLKKIFKVLGTPSDTVWPGYSTLPLVGDITFDEYAPSRLRKELKHKILSDSGLDLLQRMLIYDPKRRISAKEALRHTYFEDEQVAIDPDEFLKSLDKENDHADTGDNEKKLEYALFEFLEPDNTEANILRKRRRMELRAECNPFDLDDTEFVKRYRLTKQLTRNLCDDLRPLMKTPKKPADLSVETKVLIALAFYATGSYQRPTGSSEGHFVAQQTVSKVIAQVTAYLNTI
uniref:SFRICE_015554 n=1 Tax=Spodoptera frugiperda TaxID=7108 RepID=A0A2H1WSW7_SPOFR